LAASVAGEVNKNLGDVNYFAETTASVFPAEFLAMPMCYK
jgi:hypothetical protein